MYKLNFKVKILILFAADCFVIPPRNDKKRGKSQIAAQPSRRATPMKPNHGYKAGLIKCKTRAGQILRCCGDLRLIFALNNCII